MLSTGLDSHIAASSRQAAVPLWGRRARPNCSRARPCRNIASGDGHASTAPELKQSLQAARANLAKGVSPGAGLSSAEEQAEAAYADLLLTSMGDDEGESLTTDELQSLQQGGTMPTEKQRGGVMDLFQALAGGAHIVRQPDGRI